MAVFQRAENRQLFRVKFLIILATALLVPILMKFQAEAILTQSNPKTQQEVLRILKEAGIVEPEASVRYLEASISGVVESEEVSEALAKKIGGIRGISRVDNLLVVQSWFKLEKQGERIVASGAVSEGWKEEVASKQSDVDVSALKVRKDLELLGRSSEAWGLFIEQFFLLKGAKSLSFFGSSLTAEGEVLPSELQKLQIAAENIGPEVIFTSRLVARASSFHFPFRSLQSRLEGEPLRALARQLSEKGVTFVNGSNKPDEDGLSSLKELSSVIRQAPSAARFVLGGHPDDDGADLAAQRAQIVKKILVDAGVKESKLTIVPYESSEMEKRFSGQVEILIY